LNITIHLQWGSLFDLHMNSNFQIPTYNNASFTNYGYDNEKIHYTPSYSMIHNFLNFPKIMDYENTLYYNAPSQKITF
jgi:hypothetical protein